MRPPGTPGPTDAWPAWHSRPRGCFADEYNAPFAQLSDVPGLYAAVRDACTAVDRSEPPAFSAAVTVCCGRDDAEVRRRAEAIGSDVESLRASGGAVGTPDELVDFLSRAAAGLLGWCGSRQR